MPYQDEPKRDKPPVSRYGSDSLGILLIVVALVLIVLSFFGANIDPMLFTLPFVVGIGLLIYEAWRAMSTDLAARTKENNRLFNADERAKARETAKEKHKDAKDAANAARETAARNKAEDKKARAQEECEEQENPDVVTQHCPTCNQSLRMPRGKGTIRVTCPKCKNAFILHT